MTSDLGAARSSDLYTAELHPRTEIPGPQELSELAPLDSRIAAAQAELQETTHRITELMIPRPDESASGVLGNLERFCGHAAEGIGHFFHALFGTPELPEATHGPDLAELTARVNFRQEELHDLQQLRTELLEARAHIQALQQGDPDRLMPQAVQLRTELQPISEVLKEFAWTPVAPAAPSSEPVLDRLSHLQTIPHPGEVQETRTEVVGDPVGDAAYWHQQNGDMTCAIVDQEMILDKLAGNPDAASEFDLVQESIAKGWARPDGASSPACVGNLLQERGIHTEMVLHEDIHRLVDRLAAGEEAIVGVRGEVLWGVEPVLTGSDVNPADHAIWVTGAKVVEQNGVREVVSVFVNDSGDPNGRGREVPVELFLRAWSASDDHVIYATPAQH